MTSRNPGQNIYIPNLAQYILHAYRRPRGSWWTPGGPPRHRCTYSVYASKCSLQGLGGGGGEEIATCLILPPGKYICKVLFFSFFSPSSAFFSRPPLGVVRQAGRSALTHTSMWQGRCWGTRSRPGIFFLPFFPFSVISMRRVLCTVDQKRRRTQAPHFHNMTVCAAAQERAVGNDKEKKKFSPE